MPRWITLIATALVELVVGALGEVDGAHAAAAELAHDAIGTDAIRSGLVVERRQRGRLEPLTGRRVGGQQSFELGAQDCVTAASLIQVALAPVEGTLDGLLKQRLQSPPALGVHLPAAPSEALACSQFATWRAIWSGKLLSSPVVKPRSRASVQKARPWPK